MSVSPLAAQIMSHIINKCHLVPGQLGHIFLLKNLELLRGHFMYVGGSSRASSSRGVKAKQPECQLNIKLNVRGCGGGGSWILL